LRERGDDCLHISLFVYILHDVSTNSVLISVIFYYFLLTFVINYLKIVYTNPDESRDLHRDFKNSKKKIRQPNVLRLSNFVISKKKAKTLAKKSIS
jgi:hypothetical protein